MRNPEYNDKLSEYSKADRAIIRASLNQSRYDNKKGSAKKAVASKPVAKKAAPKPTDSRFTGKTSGTGKTRAMSGAGSMAYTPGSTKGSKPKMDSRFTGKTSGTGKPRAMSGAGSSAYTPGQKTKSLKTNPITKFITSRVGGKSGVQDSRFTGAKSGTGKPRATSGAGSMSYTPGSAKNSKPKMDSRFSGTKSGAGSPRKISGAGSYAYTPGSKKKSK